MKLPTQGVRAVLLQRLQSLVQNKHSDEWMCVLGMHMQSQVLLSHMVIQKKGRYQNCKGDKIPSRSQEFTSVLFSANILKSLIKKERKKTIILNY